MIEGLTLPFVLIPSIGGTIAGWLLTDWRLAGAAASGGFALMFIAGLFPEVIRVLALPLVSGIAVGALALAIVLFFRRDAGLWGRMTVGLLAAFFAHYGFLFFSLGQA